jgi:FK506-binding nuclear protein
MNPEDMVDLPSDEDEEDEGRVFPIIRFSPTMPSVDIFSHRRLKAVDSDHEAGTGKSAKRPRGSDATEHEPVTSDKTSKKAKKLKAENGAAVPAPVTADASAQKKGEKKDKKGKKGGEGDAKKEEGDAKPKQSDKGGLRELPNGLKIQDANVGDGPQAKKGMKVSMRYIGKLENGEIFDSNTKGKPVRCPALAVLTKKLTCSLIFTVHIQAGGW